MVFEHSEFHDNVMVEFTRQPSIAKVEFLGLKILPVMGVIEKFVVAVKSRRLSRKLFGYVSELEDGKPY